jgi:hypothetical protein
MATLQVVTPFTVQLDPVPPADPSQPTPKGHVQTRDANAPTKFVFPVAGTYEDVPDEVAEHPYTLPHLAGYEPPPVLEVPGTVIMVPVEEPPVTEAEAEAVLTPQQKAEIARRRASEAALTPQERELAARRAATDRSLGDERKPAPAAPAAQHPA